MRLIIFGLLLALTQFVFSQKSATNEFSAIDKKALSVPDSLTKTTELLAGYVTANFANDRDRSRAIFIWIASNIMYDIENMFAMNFYESMEEKITKPLKTKKGICENYAALFTDLCIKSGMKSFVVDGYTKQNGATDNLPHAWSAALIDSTWYLFDPTWGSGYVSGNSFFKRINNDYYKATPATFIKSHMPFDYLWQFLSYPVTNQEFYEDQTWQNTTKPFFDFNDSIVVFEKQSHIEQLVASARRIEKNGLKNSMIFDRLEHLRIEIARDRQNTAIALINSATADYNNGINAYNDFINFKNKQFTPKKTDAEIQNMLNVSDKKLKEATAKLGQISNADANITMASQQLAKSINDTSSLVAEQQAWLKSYLSKGKSGRKSMFYTTTWMGMPMN